MGKKFNLRDLLQVLEKFRKLDSEKLYVKTNKLTIIMNEFDEHFYKNHESHEI